MALTRDFRKTVKARIAVDATFRAALLSEAVELLLSGDVETGKSILGDFINATIGFEALAEKVRTPPKSLMRMFSVKGNRRADNLFNVISQLQQSTGVHLAVATAA
ncbi:DNA-binding protein [Rhizobium sp. 2YAF20]|uniref:helix-turn-helix domain-containing transcriptional regulator n=1 Tax=Rhizobium sp. 2YAF20 TaxID=3233027 RepID=UPI003F9BC5E5